MNYGSLRDLSVTRTKRKQSEQPTGSYRALVQLRLIFHLALHYDGNTNWSLQFLGSAGFWPTLGANEIGMTIFEAQALAASERVVSFVETHPVFRSAKYHQP